MVIKNFFSGLGLTALILLLSGCGSAEKKEERPAVNQDAASPTVTGEEEPHQDVIPQAKTRLKNPKNVAVILGGGGMLTFAHLGALKAFNQQKIPISMIIGLEWGAVPAALYAVKGSVHDAEWKMQRLKEDHLPSKGFFSSKAGAAQPGQLENFFTEVFAGERLEKTKTYFSCPSFNLAKKRVYWQRQGLARELLKRCTVYPPLYRDDQGFTAAPFAVAEAAQHARARGADLVLYVDVLGGNHVLPPQEETRYLSEALLWQAAANATSRAQIPGVDHVLSLRLRTGSVMGFAARREVMLQGQQLTDTLLEKISNQYEF